MTQAVGNTLNTIPFVESEEAIPITEECYWESGEWRGTKVIQVDGEQSNTGRALIRDQAYSSISGEEARRRIQIPTDGRLIGRVATELDEKPHSSPDREGLQVREVYENPNKMSDLCLQATINRTSSEKDDSLRSSATLSRSQHDDLRIDAEEVVRQQSANETSQIDTVAREALRGLENELASLREQVKKQAEQIALLMQQRQ